MPGCGGQGGRRWGMGSGWLGDKWLARLPCCLVDMDLLRSKWISVWFSRHDRGDLRGPVCPTWSYLSRCVLSVLRGPA